MRGNAATILAEASAGGFLVNEVKLLGLEGGEFVANATTAGDQRTPSVTKLASGGFVIVWTDASDPAGAEVKGQIYNAAGARVGGEFLVNSVSLGEQDRLPLTATACWPTRAAPSSCPETGSLSRTPPRWISKRRRPSASRSGSPTVPGTFPMR